MKLGQIALKLQLANTRFENRVFGAAELALALEYTLKAESAFVVPLDETVTPNTYDGSINQKISERFGVIVALDNGTSDRDKVGMIAYDKLDDIRTEIFSALLGWQIPGAEGIVTYGGGRIAGLNRAYLWYQFEFLVDTRLTDDDGIDIGLDDLDWFDTLYAQWILFPSIKFDEAGDVLPIGSGSQETRTLTITAASLDDENITIELDGDSDITVAVTDRTLDNAAAREETAIEIAAHDFSGLGTGWTATAVGSTVVFVSSDFTFHADSYSVTGTSVVGSFEQTVAGYIPGLPPDTDMTSIIDFTTNPDVDGPFGAGFGIKFDVFKP